MNILVAKFDERTQYEWEYFKSKNTGKTYDRFFNFLLDRYDCSKSMIARLQSYDSSDTLKTGAVNHVSVSCYKCQKWIAKGSAHTCAACGDVTLAGNKLNHCIEHCAKYIVMSVNQRSDR